MKIIHVVLVLLLVIAGITISVLTGDVPPGATGVPHLEIAGLSVSGDAAASAAALGAAPYYFQIGVILLAGSLLYMGVPERRRDSLLKVAFFAGVAFALFVWSMIWGGYQNYLETGETTIVFGFPLPTSWMLGGVWASFLTFDLFYVFAFYRYFLHPDDEATFHALVADMAGEEEVD